MIFVTIYKVIKYKLPHEAPVLGENNIYKSQSV